MVAVIHIPRVVDERATKATSSRERPVLCIFRADGSIHLLDGSLASGGRRVPSLRATRSNGDGGYLLGEPV